MDSTARNVFLILFLMNSVTSERLLELTSLSEYPLATCNDGSPAVYYKEPDHLASSGNYLIYLRGGGMCVPFVPGVDCQQHCQHSPHLCSASTDLFLDLDTSPLGDNVGSADPTVNPAFHDFRQVYVPYCSSDWYTGTRDASPLTQNFTFHGHFIIEALVKDLIAKTEIAAAEKVVLMGGSAGAIGTEANCDFVAEELQALNPSIEVKCVSDSGSLYPLHTHSDLCYPNILEFACYEMWTSRLDRSCLDQTSKINCVSATTYYPYIETPIMFLMSSEDTVIRMCYESEEEFWQRWRQELGTVARKMTEERAEVGMYLANCPFHQALFYPPAYSAMEVTLLDSQHHQKALLKDILVNFIRAEHPYQAIDDMTRTNDNCPKTV